jgi:Pyruvate/2-oxoacid:ferredoxin oxidoreductase delta subunit/flavodoxin
MDEKIGLAYLSLTGNTKKITEAIGERFSADGYVVSYYDMMDETNRSEHPREIGASFLARNDVIGFGCFSSEYQPMFFFKRLLSNIRGLRGKSYFVYCTYGAEFGATLQIMREALGKSGALFLGGDAFPCSDEVKALLVNRIYLHHDKPGDAEYDRARLFASRIIRNREKLRAGAVLARDEKALPRGRPVLSLMGRFIFKQKLVRYLTKFTIDENRCVRCGWCVRICPSISLSFKSGRRAPVVDSNCQGCGICFECRQKAVIHVFDALTNKTAGRWARTFYSNHPRKQLDDREFEALKADRFAITKFRPELMSLRR